MTGIERLGSGGPWEAAIGYSRVVRMGSLAMTAGCTGVVDGVVTHPGDAGAQTTIAIDNALTALSRVGLTPEQVVFSRMYVVDGGDTEAVGRAHGAVFGDIRPAATMVLVAGLLDPQMLVEVELTAWADQERAGEPAEFVDSKP